jgi:O-Antigen ligase
MRTPVREASWINTPAPTFAPYRLFWIAAIIAAAGVGALIPLAADLKLQIQAILAIAILGLGAYLVIPNRRISLVCAWVLAFPLSLEKTFPIFSPTYSGFLIAPVVVSGADFIFLLLLVTMALESLASKRSLFRWPAPATPYALLVAWVFMVFLAKSPTTEGLLQLLHWSKMLVFLVTMSSAIRTREELMTVLVTLAVAVLMQSVILGISYELKRPIGFSTKIGSSSLLAISTESSTLTRATGTVGHSNQQATYQTLFTIPIVALFMVRNWIWRFAAALVFLASFGAIILTFTRSSWLSGILVLGLVVSMAWKRGKITQAGWMGICLGALAAMAVVACFSGPIITRLTKADDGASLSRVHLAMLSLQHIGKNPVAGVGPGNFINAALANAESVKWAGNVWLPRGFSYEPRFIGDMELDQIYVGDRWYFSSLPAHNKFLLIASELGLVGLGLFIWFQWRLLQDTLGGLRACDPALWWLGVVLLGAFVASLSVFMFELFNDDKTVLMPLFVNVLMISFARIALRRDTADGREFA